MIDICATKDFWYFEWIILGYGYIKPKCTVNVWVITRDVFVVRINFHDTLQFEKIIVFIDLVDSNTILILIVKFRVHIKLLRPSPFPRSSTILFPLQLFFDSSQCHSECRKRQTIHLVTTHLDFQVYQLTQFKLIKQK